jgi:hypothetical protein
MAWVRTATSLISFGFTIYKAFEYLRQRQPDVAHGVLGPRNFALVLIGLGIGALVLATVQHRGDLRRLEAQYGPLPRSTAAIVATVVSSSDSSRSSSCFCVRDACGGLRANDGVNRDKASGRERRIKIHDAYRETSRGTRISAAENCVETV